MVSRTRVEKDGKDHVKGKVVYQVVFGGLAITNQTEGCARLERGSDTTVDDAYVALASLTRTLGRFKSSRSR